MALQVIDIFDLTYDTVSIADEVDGATISVEGQEVDGRTGATGLWDNPIAGTKSWSISFTVKAELAAAKIRDKLWATFNTADRTADVTFKAQNAGITAANPEWSGTVLVNNVMGIGATVGEIPGGSITLKGVGALAKATA